MKKIELKNLFLIVAIFSFLLIIFNYTWLFKNFFIPIYNGEIKGDFQYYYRAFIALKENIQTVYLENYQKFSPAFIYPPPSIFILSVFCLFGLSNTYFILNIFSILVYIISILLMIRIFEVNYSKFEKYLVLIIFIALAPITQNIKAGQINSIVLFVSVLSIYFLKKEKIVLSSLFLVLGFWLKLYPIFLLPFFLNKNNYK